MATTYGVAVESMRPRRNRRVPERLEDAVITAETIGNRDAPVLDYRVQVYYSTLDTILEEMNSRFSDTNLSLLCAMQALLPTSDKFVDVDTLRPILQHYEIDTSEVQAVVKPAVLNTYKHCRYRKCIRWHIPMYAIFARLYLFFHTCPI